MNNIQVNDNVKWFKGVNSLRFILALVVLLSHLKNPVILAMKHSEQALWRYLGMLLGVSFVGIVAVVAFFVISGFVIHYPNKNHIASLKNFYIRRYLRVLVPLIPIKIIGFWWGSPENTVVWSLYCELIYYTVYPFMTAVKLCWRTKIIAAYVISTILILWLAQNSIKSFFLQTNIHYNGEYATHGGIFLTWLIALPFWLLGVQLAERIDYLTAPISFKKVLAFRFLILLLAIITSALNFHYYLSYIFSMSIISIPVARWIEMEICYYKTREANQYLEKWGKFSYSLYLSHPILISVLITIIPLSSYTYPLYIVIIIMTAYCFYLLFERPSQWLSKKITSKN